MKNRHQWTPELQLGIQFRLAGPAESWRWRLGVEEEKDKEVSERKRGEKEEEEVLRRSTWFPLSAGFSWWTGSGESGRGSQTRGSTCTLLRDSRTPGCTGGHGNRGIGSTRSCANIQEQAQKLHTPQKQKSFRTVTYNPGAGGDGLTLHSEYAWIQPPCSPSPWPAERGSRQTAQTDGPSCSPTRRWSCGTPCGSAWRRRQHKLKLSSVKEWAAGLLCLCVWSLQHSRWAWRRSSSQCGRRCCHCRPQSGGSLPSPGQTAGRRSWSAHSPPSCQPEV